MAGEIRSVYQFDFVHDGQKVFRELLSAMANPGQIRRIGAQAEKFQGDYAPLLALGCTLLDNEEKVYPYIKKVIRLRSDLEIEYPLGVDLVFIDGSGKMIGVPRLVKID